MQALVKAKPEPGLWHDLRPIPEPRNDDVIVKVRRSGICGTDLHIYNWDEWAERTIPIPLIIGHEYSGEIVEVGPLAKHLRVGQRVSGEGHVVGSQSRAVRAGRFNLDPATKGIGVNLPGAFAEYVRIPAFDVVALPDDIDDDTGAILDPLGNAVYTALSFDLAGEDVLVTGAGPIGIMAAAVARHVGARHVVITDLNPTRLDLASRVADVVAVNVGEEELSAVMSRLGTKEGFDVGFEMSGSPTALETMVDHVVVGGKIALLGIPARPFVFDWTKLIFRMITVKGIYGREIFETWHKMIAMLQNGVSISKVITHRFRSRDFLSAFEIMKRGECGKIIPNWT